MATPLKFLLDEINFQRTKELRQSIQEHEGTLFCDSDQSSMSFHCLVIFSAGGFSGFWTDLFVRHFIFETTNIQTQDSDDLLFFVRHKHVKGSSRTTPKYQVRILPPLIPISPTPSHLPLSIGRLISMYLGATRENSQSGILKSVGRKRFISI